MCEIWFGTGEAVTGVAVILILVSLSACCASTLCIQQCHCFSKFPMCLLLVRLRMMRLRTMQFFSAAPVPSHHPLPWQCNVASSLICPDLDLTHASVKLFLLSNHWLWHSSVLWQPTMSLAIRCKTNQLWQKHHGDVKWSIMTLAISDPTGNWLGDEGGGVVEVKPRPRLETFKNFFV